MRDIGEEKMAVLRKEKLSLTNVIDWTTFKPGDEIVVEYKNAHGLPVGDYIFFESFLVEDDIVEIMSTLGTVFNYEVDKLIDVRIIR